MCGITWIYVNSCVKWVLLTYFEIVRWRDNMRDYMDLCEQLC